MLRSPRQAECRDALKVSQALTRIAGPSSRSRSSTPSAASSATRASPTMASHTSFTSASTSQRRTARVSTRPCPARLSSTPCTRPRSRSWSERRRVQLLARRSEHPPGPARRGIRDRDRSYRGAVRPRALFGEGLRALSQSSANRRHGPVRRRHQAHRALGRGARRHARRGDVRRDAAGDSAPLVRPAGHARARPLAPARLPRPRRHRTGAPQPTSGSRSHPRPSSTIGGLRERPRTTCARQVGTRSCSSSSLAVRAGRYQVEVAVRDTRGNGSVQSVPRSI